MFVLILNKKQCHSMSAIGVKTVFMLLIIH